MERTIYQFDTRSGEYAGSALARRSPLEPDVFLIPSNATETPPPAAPAGQVAVFRSGAWQLVPDDRGTWFAVDGAAIQVAALGAKPETAVTRDAPPAEYMRWGVVGWELDAERKRAADLAALSAETESQLSVIVSKYPLSEVLSWPKQEAEARALLADAQAVAPLLTTMAQIRGLPVLELAARVVAKADAYTTAVAQAVGTRQKREDEITAV